MTAAKYPADYYDHQWGRIHQGHGLSRHALWVDLRDSVPQPPNSHMRVDELHLREIPRVMWCERYDSPCEFNGEWHRHWTAVKPGDEASEMTQAYWSRGGDAA